MTRSVVVSGAFLFSTRTLKSICPEVLANPSKMFLLVLVVLSLVGAGITQNSDPAAGFPAFVTSVSGQFDTLNLPYGNVHVEFPVRAKAGKYPLTYSLDGNSHAYIGAPSNSNYYYGKWYVSHGLRSRTSGSQFSSSLNTAVSFTGSTADCGGGVETTYQNFTVGDSNGTIHPIQAGVQVTTGYCGNSSYSGTTTDNSGYTMQLQGANGGVQVTLWDKSGNLLESPSVCQPRAMG
jgi:hypothetical protein